MRFISTLVFTPNEITLFKEKFKNCRDILNAIAYYQENDKETYNREFKKINSFYYFFSCPKIISNV